MYLPHMGKEIHERSIRGLCRSLSSALEDDTADGLISYLYKHGRKDQFITVPLKLNRHIGCLLFT